MSEVEDYYQNQRLSAQRANYASQDDNSDEVAEAVDLSNDTGVPSAAIYDNLEDFKRAHKLALAKGIIDDNEYIASYLNSHPMAASISHDDLGALDDHSRSLDALPGESRFQLWLKSDSMARSFQEGFGEQPFGQALFQRPTDIDWALSHPLAASAAGALSMPIEALTRTTGGLLRMGYDGMSAVFGESFAREMAAMAEYGMMRGDIGVKGGGGIRTGFDLNEQLVSKIKQTSSALGLADIYTAADKEPAIGIHPLIDKAKSLQTKEDLNALDEALSTATKSATRERSSDFFANFERGRIGDREIGIEADAIRRLYGDKPPTPDDGILGWVPDLEAKLTAAEGIGGDVQVPLADWLAKVEPDVARELHDDIRVRDNGLTINETKIGSDIEAARFGVEPKEGAALHPQPEAKETIAEPLQATRGSAGLEPMFSVGDRKLSIQRRDPLEGIKKGETAQQLAERYGNNWSEMSLHERAVWQDRLQGIAIRADEFRIHDETGKKVGWLEVTPHEGGKKLYIDNIGGFESLGFGPNAFGPALTRSLIKQLKEAYPNVEQIGGFRVSGAREKAGTEKEAWIKVQAGDQLDYRQHEYFKQLLTQNWEEMGHGLLALFHQEGKGLAANSLMGQMVLSELRRLVPEAESDVAHTIKAPGGFLQGVFIPNLRSIIVSLRADDPIGTARHESIHALRNFGLFTDREWAVLDKAAVDEGWMEKYDIAGRWKNFKLRDAHEEAVAEAYLDWARGAKASPEVHGLFERIKAFFENLRQRLGEMLGHDLSWEQIFEKIDKGEIGAREADFDTEGDIAAQAKAANDPDVKGLERAKTYDAAAKKQQIERLVDKDTERGDAEYWRKVATNEGHLGLTGKPNPFVAAREHSRDGKTTLHIGVEGKRTVFQDGVKVVRESFRDLPDQEPKFQPEDSGLYDRGAALGVTQTHMDRMLRLIDKRNKEDLEGAQRRAETRQRRKSNVEFKERRTQLRDEVRESLSQRPDLAMDELFAKNKIKIDPATLSTDQRERLPKDYVQKKDGVNPDDLAPYFGYTSGDALVERLGMLTEDRRRSGMSQRDYFNRLVDVETDRRLNSEFGDRQQTILDEAKDQALSETQLNLTHEETLAYALKAGTEPQFTKEETRAMVKQVFDQTPVGQLSSDRLLQTAGKVGKKIEEAGAKGNWAEAYRLSQQRNHAVIAAKLARDYEKARASFDRTAKTFSKNRIFPGVEQEYVNWIQDLLLRTGHSLRRSVQDLAENIGRQSETTLADFIDAKEAEFMGMRQLDVPDFLRDEAFRKPIDELTANEFEGLRQGIKILEKAGRDEKSVMVGGEAWDRAKVKSEMRQQLETFGYSTAKFNLNESKFKALRMMAYGLTNMETLLNRWDRGNPMGVFNRVVIHPLVEAANGKSRLLREVAKDLNELERPTAKELQKKVDAPFPDPMTPDGQGDWTGFNRSNVLMMLQNAGNKSNWNVLARGYSAEPEALFKWLQKNVTRKDVERAAAIGDIFKKLVAQADKLYERLTGATVEKIPLQPIHFDFADGTSMDVPGWYHPLDRDPIRASMWKEDKDTGIRERTGSRSRESAFEDADYFHASTSNGYTKKRTGAIYPVSLDFNLVPTRMRQMSHDIHFREPLLNVEKIFGDRLFKEDVAKYYGKEYADGLMPYLRHLAGSEGIRSANAIWADSFLEKARQNIISTYIGFNPFTIFKHGPTAAWFSSRQVGTGEFFKAMAELNKPGSADTVKFIMDNSEELQRRERHWQDTLAGQGNELSDKSTTRERIIDWGSKGVAASDMFSARPTWWAAYQKARSDQLSHGQSVTLADRAVRLAHGSTAETNLPPLSRSGGIANRYFTSVYGFFGTAMQRRIEIAHQLNDTYQLGREGELKAAAKNVPKILGDFMTYVVWPTIVEEAVTGMTTEDKRGWGTHVLSGATMGLASSFLYVRDLVYGLTTGHDPGAGLISSAMHDAANVVRDVRKGKDAWSRQHAGKTVEDTLTLFGEATGKMPKTVARAARFGIDVAAGQQKPKTPIEWMRGMAHGEAQRRKR